DRPGPRPPRRVVAARSSARGAGRGPGARGGAALTIEDVPAPLQIAFAAAFGALVGSFLNVCIYRLPLDKSVVWPASACPYCGRLLSWYENIPVLSWLALRARGRPCAAPIGIRSPIIQELTATMVGFAWWYYGPGVLLASRLVLGCALIVLFA